MSKTVNKCRHAQILIADQLRLLGFEKPNQKFGILTIPLQEDFIGWLGLNSGSGYGPGIVDINPVVGIRCQSLEHFLAQVTNSKDDALTPPTVSANIGYIAPQSRYWPFLFGDEATMFETVTSLTDAVKEFGLPFMNHNSNLHNLVNTLETGRFNIPVQTDYRLAIALYKLGRIDALDEMLSNRLTKLEHLSYPAATRFKRFVFDLRAHLNKT